VPRPAWLSDDAHADIVRRIAATRFPFPDQTDWPSTYRTMTNAGQQRHGVETPSGMLFPDIVILDDATQTVAEIGIVVTDLTTVKIEPWQHLASLAKRHPHSAAPHFFIYVPEGLEGEAVRLLEQHDIPFGGLRTFALDSGETLRVEPVDTPVDPKDHRRT
jgi:hypothetical protein